MCGIVGLWQKTNIRTRAELEALVKRMTGTIVHRGPDGSGAWVDANARCAFGHRRLSIIDTSNAGAQPFASHDKRWWVTFNGEIYNFKDIRAQLERKGHIFRSRSDTEVLVEALAEWGTSAIEKFDGMFAFAAFDTHAGQLLLARDPFGEKPLYFTTLADGTFAFASELRSLEILPGFDRTIGIDAVAEYLMFQYIGAPRAIYEHVAKLPPAHVMLKSETGAETHRYYRFDPGKDLFHGRSLSDLADELEDILIRSIERRLISDVPLGAFLSGGVDSSLVCALATQKLRVPLNTYSIGFHDAPESEHLVAREFAKHLGTVHHDEIVSPNVEGFLDMVGRVLDEPNADTSCLPTYLLSGFARQDVTVAVSGDGGDEMFGGYGRYTHTLLQRDLHEIGELPGWNAGRSYYGPGILIASESDVRDLLGYLPPEFQSHLAKLRAEIDSSGQHLLAALRRSDVENYLPGAVLPKVDRMSMQHSLEVRTPYLNVEVANFAQRLPEPLCARRYATKRLLRQLACRYLPPHLVNLPKQGFGLPMADWARNSLLPKATAMLGGGSALRRGLGAAPIDRLLARHSAPNGFNAYQLWSVVVLEAWLRERGAELPVSLRQKHPFRSSHAALRAWREPIGALASAPGKLIRTAVGAMTKKARIRADDFFTQIVKGAPDTSCEAPLVPGDRVAVFTHALPPGGAERQWVYLARALQKMGFDVCFIVLTPLQGENAHYLPILRSAGVELVQACDLPCAMQAARLCAQFPNGFDGFADAHALAYTINALRLISARVVFAQLDGPNILAATAGLICGIDRIVVSFRNYNPSNFDYFHKPWFQSAYRALASSPKVVLAGNFSGANEDYANWLGISKSRVSTIPNALDRELFAPASREQIRCARQELDLPEGTPVVLGVFRFYEEKGPLDFIKAAIRIAKESRAVHVLIVGIGQLEAEMRQCVNASAASSRIHFLGRRDDVSTLMSIASLLLHAGKKEGMPNVIMEAMLSGLPVVATDAGATRDLIADGETGFVHEIGDVQRLANSCLRILGDPDLAARMKNAAALRAKDQFSPQKMAERYLEVTGLYTAPDRNSGALADVDNVRPEAVTVYQQ